MCETSSRRIFITPFQELKEFRGHRARWNHQCKNQTSVMKETKRLQSTIETPEGPRKCLKLVIQREKKNPLVAIFGGLPLKRRKNPPIEDRVILPYARITSEIVERLLNDTCVVCGSKENVEMHHVHHLKDLNKKGKREMPLWMKIMISRKRKSIPLALW